MRLDHIEQAEDGGVKLIFSYGKHFVEKIIKITRTTDKPIPYNLLAYNLLKTSIEAHRDLLYMLHGDKWKEFDEAGTNWVQNMTQEERKMIFDLIRQAA